MFVSRGVVLVLLVGLVPSAHAATFTVTNTATSGAGSLHQAILNANATPVADTITFAIAGGGVKTIAGDLPAISEPLTIDGYSQPGTLTNTTLSGATDATLRIVLDGSELTTGNATLAVLAGPTTIRGLVLAGINAKNSGISVSAAATDVSIHGCFVGTDATGQADDSQGFGILVDGQANVGTFAAPDRNLISGNDGAGIVVRGSDSVIEGNLIGLDADGNADLGNGDGIQVSGAGAGQNRVGGTVVGSGNDIAGNEDNGILVLASADDGNTFVRNRIRGNGELGIDLGNNGVTHNDEGDGDTGPNRLQNFPELAFARTNGNVLRVEGLLNAEPGLYEVEFFRSESTDESGFGEGEVFVGALPLNIPAGASLARFTAALVLGPVPTEPFFVTATATSPGAGTSEFSRAIEAPIGGTQIAVTNTNASGAGSFAAALAAANSDESPNTIVFNIPGDGPHVIQPTGEQAINERPAIIDGYTQPGASINTLESGTNAQIPIVIDGANSTTAAIGVFRTTAVIRGIVVNNGGGEGIRFVEAENARVEGCFIGTDAAGEADVGNAEEGVRTGESVGIEIGGPSRANRNLISGNDFRGIGDTATGSVIRNNLIGSDAAGTGNIPNEAAGIIASGFETTIGGDEPGLGNLVRGNNDDGIEVAHDSTAVEILGNDIFDNELLGIDLVEFSFQAGVTANDADDADAAGVGANALQNFPVIEAVTRGTGKITVEGSLDVPAEREGTIYRLRFYRNQSCDPSGHGEGELFVAALSVLIPASEEFTLQIPVTVEEGEFLTATATDPETGNTSEFSECFEVGEVDEAPLCGDATLNDDLATGDALIVLQVAVGDGECELCVCDTNGNGQIQSSDALLALKAAVGQPVTLECPVCD